MLFFLCLWPGLVFSASDSPNNWGRWSHSELAQLIAAARQIDDPGERIVALSRHFLATPYVAHSLIGGPQQPEQLVINLAGFDCFTFLDVVEALRRAADFDDFPEQLKQVRYRGSVVAYERRRHFFSDWVANEADHVTDVTEAVGQGRTRLVIKQLNQKNDGAHWLPGIPVTPREISYLPTGTIDNAVLSALHPGDYVGVYSTRDGLDVSHTGLIVRENGRVLLRHASSLDGVRRVVDDELLAYLQGKPGLVVYRANARDLR